jgi:hypothetical protein
MAAGIRREISMHGYKPTAQWVIEKNALPCNQPPPARI